MDALSRRPWLYPAAIALLGLALRVYRLDFQDAWYDEAFSIVTCARPTGAMLAALVKDWGHPPLYFYLLHLWQAAFGIGPFQARLLSVVFGTLAIPMIYLLAESLFGRRAGLIAALLLAVSQLGVMYSQEARPYAQLLFFVLATVYWFVRALRDRGRAQICLLALSAAAMLYTHYYAWFVFGVLLLFAAVFRGRYAIRRSWCILALAAAIVLYVPWLATGVAAQALDSGGLASQSSQSSVHPSSALAALNWFNNGKVFGARAASPLWSFPAGMLLFTLPAVVALKPRDRGWLLLVAALAVVPAALALGISSLTHVIYFVRYIAFCIGPYYILVARGVAGLRYAAPALAAIVLYSVPALYAQYSVPYKGETRQALAYLVSEYREGDCVVFQSSAGRSGNPPLQWQVYRLPSVNVVRLEDAAAGNSRCGRVWFVWKYAFWEPRTPDEQRSRDLLQARYREISGRDFEGLDIRLFIGKT